MQTIFKLRINISLFFTLTLLSANVLAVSQAVLVKPLQDYVDQLKTISADFIQVKPDEDTFELNRSEGHFDLKRPSMLYWKYTTPEPKTIVIDGKNLWFYDENIDQVTVKELSEVKENIPIGWLLFNEPITKKFKVIFNREKSGKLWYNLSPKKASYFHSIDIGMKNGKISNIVMYQSSDNITRIKLKNAIENQMFTDSYFRFKPPIAVDIIGQPQKLKQ